MEEVVKPIPYLSLLPITDPADGEQRYCDFRTWDPGVMRLRKQMRARRWTSSTTYVTTAGSPQRACPGTTFASTNSCTLTSMSSIWTRTTAGRSRMYVASLLPFVAVRCRQRYKFLKFHDTVVVPALDSGTPALW